MRFALCLSLLRLSLAAQEEDPEQVAARKALQPAAIQARIRQFRMGEVKIVVQDRRGRALPNAKVWIEQRRHAFLFGCTLPSFDALPLETGRQEVQQRFADLFNSATLSLDWAEREPPQGRPQYDRLERMAQWCREHSLVVKGSVLIASRGYPGWASSAPERAIPLLRQRVFAVIPRYRRLISYWEVVSDANPIGDRADGVTNWIERDGAATVVQKALAWARQASGGAPNTLLYTEFDGSDANFTLLRELKRRNALPDAIAIQADGGSDSQTIEATWARITRFATFGKPIHYTEATMGNDPTRNARDQSRLPEQERLALEEKQQAAATAQWVTALFSHPAVRAIAWRDFSDSEAGQGATSGLLRKDRTPKLVYKKLYDLIKREWRTNVQGRTNRDGVYQTRAFHGAHTITVEIESRRFDFPLEIRPGEAINVVTIRAR